MFICPHSGDPHTASSHIGSSPLLELLLPGHMATLISPRFSDPKTGRGYAARLIAAQSSEGLAAIIIFPTLGILTWGFMEID